MSYNFESVRYLIKDFLNYSVDSVVKDSLPPFARAEEWGSADYDGPCPEYALAMWRTLTIHLYCRYVDILDTLYALYEVNSQQDGLFNTIPQCARKHTELVHIQLRNMDDLNSAIVDMAKQAKYTRKSLSAHLAEVEEWEEVHHTVFG